MRFYNRKSIVASGMAAIFLLFAAAPALALFIEIDFTVDNFELGLSTTNPVPFDPVKGTIVFQGDPNQNLIQSLTMINLKIGEHNYSLNEVGVLSEGTRQIFGGLINDVNGLGPDPITFANTNDFIFNLKWNENILSPLYFQYTTSSVQGSWYSYSFPSFSVSTVDRVPEPAPLILLCSGLIALWGFRRKFGR